MFGLRIIRAPYVGQVFTLGKPSRVIGPGVHWVSPMLSNVVVVSTALRTEEVDMDVITKGGTPTTIKVGRMVPSAVTWPAGAVRDRSCSPAAAVGTGVGAVLTWQAALSRIDASQMNRPMNLSVFFMIFSRRWKPDRACATCGSPARRWRR